jgi:hypothetical protein
MLLKEGWWRALVEALRARKDGISMEGRTACGELVMTQFNRCF